MTAGATSSARRFSSIGCLLLYLGGMVIIYIGERLFPEPITARLILDGSGMALIALALAARLRNRAVAEGDHSSVEGLLALCYLGGLAALGLYGAQIEELRAPLSPMLDPGGLPKYRVILHVLWPIVWLGSILPALFVEVSYASMARGEMVEQRRIKNSAGSGLAIALTCSILFVVNYIGAEHNIKRDLSFLRTTAPGASTRHMVAHLQEPFEVLLFYPVVNEVKEDLLAYFEELRDVSGQFRLRVVDQPMEPNLAREHKVSNNGILLCTHGEKSEKLHVGMKLDAAKSKLSKLDVEFQKMFRKLVMEERIAYFTTGHEERGSVPGPAAGERGTINLLKTLLRSQNFKIKTLGLTQGLAGEIPADATVVFVIDPRKDFQEAELETLRRYLRAGGRMFAALEPESTSNFSELLREFGLRYSSTMMANEKQYMRRRYNRSDRYNLYTNRFSSHTSVTTLSRSSSSLAVIMPGTGFLEEVGGGEGAKVSVTVRSMPMTWADGNKNMEADEGEEMKIYDLAAVVSATAKPDPVPEGDGEGEGQETPEDAPEKAPEKSPNKSEDEQPGPEMRLFVLSDADALSDEVIRNLGNYYLCSDSVKWLLGEDAYVGEVASSEDVPIVHTGKEDMVWFYSTIFAVPLIIMGFGIVYNRRRSRVRGPGGAR